MIYNILLYEADHQFEIILISAFDGISYGLFVGTAINYMQTISLGRISSATSLYMNALFSSALASGPIIGFVALEASFRYCILLSAILSLSTLVLISITRVIERFLRTTTGYG